MFHLRLQSADHVRHYSISVAQPTGWEVRLEEDHTLLRVDHYKDWHRVERAWALFKREVSDLQDSGWRVLGGSSR